MPFFDEHNGGPGIGSAFNGLTPKSRVRLEWFNDAEDSGLIFADYSIRDGRLNKEVFHPLTLSIQLKYRNGDDKCMVRFGRYYKDPKIEELINSLKSLTGKPVSKKQLISIIKKSIDLYQKHVIEFHLNNYGLPANNMIQQHPDDFLNFKKYLDGFYAEENNKKNKDEFIKVNKEDEHTPMWIILTTSLSVVFLAIYIFLLILRK